MTTFAHRSLRLAIAGSLAVTLLAACGEDETAETTASTVADEAADGETTGDVEAFCDLATELVGVTPTAEQVARYADLAPAEIAEPAAVFATAFAAASGDLDAVFAAPDVAEAVEAISQFESDECGISQPGPPAEIPAG